MRQLIIFIAVFVIFILATLSNTNAGLSGSAHDFNSEDACIICHLGGTSGSADDLDIPIIDWTFEIYQSPTMDASPGQPRGVSLLCLSCHDGTTAPGTYNLKGDHPVSFLYEESVTRDPYIKDNMTELPLYDGYLECATCHDPHNLSGFSKLLRKNNSNSALCFTCHNK